MWLYLASVVAAVLVLWLVLSSRRRSISGRRTNDTRKQPSAKVESSARAVSAPAPSPALVTPNLSIADTNQQIGAKRAQVSRPPARASMSSLAEEIPSRAPVHQWTEALDKDAWEDWSDELYAEASKELKAELKITYRDRNGKITHRDVTTEKYARTSDGGVMAAFCHLRNARRPFYFSRILSVVDRSSGSKIDDLGSWLDLHYEATPNGERDLFIDAHEAALGALFFVAKADGAFQAKEKEVFRRFCLSQGLSSGAVQQLVIDSVSGWVVPSRIAYGKDLRSLQQRDEPYRRVVFEYAVQIVGTGKTVRDEETRSLERMKKELRLNG